MGEAHLGVREASPTTLIAQIAPIQSVLLIGSKIGGELL